MRGISWEVSALGLAVSVIVVDEFVDRLIENMRRMTINLRQYHNKVHQSTPVIVEVDGLTRRGGEINRTRYLFIVDRGSQSFLFGINGTVTSL